jgi:hypothetical protein
MVARRRWVLHVECGWGHMDGRVACVAWIEGRRCGEGWGHNNPGMAGVGRRGRRVASCGVPDGRQFQTSIQGTGARISDVGMSMSARMAGGAGMVMLRGMVGFAGEISDMDGEARILGRGRCRRRGQGMAYPVDAHTTVL